MARFVDIDNFRDEAFYADTEADIASYVGKHGYADVAPISTTAKEIFSEIEKILSVKANGEAVLDITELHKIEQKYIKE